MAGLLRPDLIVRQVFRTAQPVVPASTLPAVLVGIHRQLEYHKSAGSFIGGQDNGDYYFPDLIDGSAVEPQDQTDEVLEPKVYLSNDYGVADITADVDFNNLDNPATVPYFTVDPDVEAEFSVATGTTGEYDSDTGLFLDDNADFIGDRVAANDVILISGVRAFEVTSLDSDNQLTVSRINHGPSDARVLISTKDAYNIRTLTYLGDNFEFISEGVAVGDLVTLDGWEELTSNAGLTFTATDSDGHRDLTATGEFPAASVSVGDVVVIQDLNNPTATMPAFTITDPASTGNNAAVAANVVSVLPTTEVAGGSYPERFFQTYTFAANPYRAPSEAGYFSSRTLGVRTFSDSTADFGVTQLNVGDWIMVFDADTGVISAGITYAQDAGGDTITRSDGGSWLDDGFADDMAILIRASATTDNIGEWNIATVTDTVITLVEALAISAGAGTAVEVTSTRVAPLFAVTGTPPALLSGATSFSVVDLTEGLLADAQVGGPLRYSIFRPSALSTSHSDSSDVSAVDGTTEVRSLEWPEAFTNTTIPTEGDFVFNAEGVLLFEVAAANLCSNAGGSHTNHSAHGGLTFADVANTITRASGSWITDGYKIGDIIQVYGSEDSANDVSMTVTNVLALVLTVDDVPADTSAAPDSTATVQRVDLTDHNHAGYTMAEDDVISQGSLVIRSQNESVYSVVRVTSNSQIQIRHVNSADQVTDLAISGMVTTITVKDTLSNASYEILKNMTGGALEGTILVDYAARRNDLADQLIEVTQANVEEVAGYAVPANPLGLAAANAVANTSVPVLLVQVAEDTQAGWASALEFIKTDQVYAVAPLTQNEARLAEFQAHVALESQPEQKRERILFQSHRTETQETRWTMDPDADTADLVYNGTTQTLTVDHTGGLVGLGAVVGDVVEGTYTGYVLGQGYVNGSLSARVVNISESGSTVTLTLLPDTTVPVTLAAGIRMDTLALKSRVLSTTQLRDAIAAYPGTIQDRRVRNVYPDRALVTFTDGTNPDDETTGLYGGGTVADYEVGGWLMAAIAAAQRSGLPASTPLTKRPFLGIQRLVNPFGNNISYLDTILDAGNYLLSQAGGDNVGVEAVRAVTTDVTDLNYLEESVTVQLDNFARKLRRQVAPILGSTILDEAFFDLFSMISQAVVTGVLTNREIRELELVSITEDPDRADTFLASYSAKPFFSAAKGDVTIYI